MSETQDSDEGMDGSPIDLTTLSDTESDDEGDTCVPSRQTLRRQHRRRLRKMTNVFQARRSHSSAVGFRRNVTCSSGEESSDGYGFSANETSDSELKIPATKTVRKKTKNKQVNAAKKKKQKMKATDENLELGVISKRTDFEPLCVIEELKQVFYLRSFFSNDQLNVWKKNPSYQEPIQPFDSQSAKKDYQKW